MTFQWARFRSSLRPIRIVWLALAILATAPLGGTPADARDIPGSFADLVDGLMPAVVNISTSQTVERPDLPSLPDGPFQDLFRDFFERGQPRGPREVQSLGSGFVVSADGYVVTNNHVIRDADQITVNLADGRSFEAEIVGTDPKTDLALMKIEADQPLSFVRFGDSSDVRVGDWVLAIGNPFGLGGSVSAGIVSARNRDIQAGPYDDFLQTDAAINRGNSGGPLFDLRGNVIGVNTAIISPSGGSIGIGFAVPSTLANSVIDQLREFGETRRGWLGVRIQQVTDELADALALDAPTGALVASVTADGPAEAGGIAPGDVILRFDGREVAEMRDLPRMVAETPVGKTVRVLVSRKGKTQTLRVQLGRLEDQEGTVLASVEPDADVPTEPDADLENLGLSLGALTGATRSRFGIADDVVGVLVTEVAPDGPAARKGIKPGDVVVEVGQEPVTTPAEVEAQIGDAVSANRSSVLLLLQSGEDLRFVPLAIGG
ncbi:MAG: DegQ family serine endoprotease [Paracoccaceae bacterium]